MSGTRMAEPVIIGNASLYLGDCIEVLPTLPEKANAVITDPPFSSGARTDAGKSSRGGMLRGAKWQDDWFSHDNMATHGFLYLMRFVCLRLLEACAPTATGHFFIDWRMYPNLYGTLEAAGWIAKNLVVWDKQHFGMGGNYRNQHEFIIYAEKGKAEFFCNSLGNVLRVGRAPAENHPTEKPVELLEKLINVSTKRSDLVLDPFMGSGTTGVACANLGRRFVGIDISEQHFQTACERIEAAHAQGRLFA